MRIRIWNAFASNNSGSYTIVGRFDSQDSAAKVVSEVLALVKEQSAWLESHGVHPSPLTAFAKRNGLKSHQELGDEDWPAYSEQEHPDVWTVGSQVFLYAGYQLTMTRLFGELIYARGGRVEYEAEHAHHPMAALFEIYWPWKGKTKEKIDDGVRQILKALHDDTRFYDNQREGAPYHAWRVGTNWHEPDLRIGTVFHDLISGFAAVDGAVRSAGAEVSVRLFESFSEEGNEFEFLRPSEPILGP